MDRKSAIFVGSLFAATVLGVVAIGAPAMAAKPMPSSSYSVADRQKWTF